MDIVYYLSHLSYIGWFGLLLWFIIPILLVWGNKEWFFDFDERKPQFDFLTEMVSEMGLELPFLGLRLIVLQGLMMSIGFMLMQLTLQY